jgi:hypothetical protein
MGKQNAILSKHNVDTCISLSTRINVTQTDNTYKQLSITYSNFIPFKHRLINPFVCCIINFLT